MTDTQPNILCLLKQQDDFDFVEQFLPDFLLAEIYSSTVFRQARAVWNDLPFYVRENIPTAIQKLILTPMPSKKCTEMINRYWLKRGIEVLEGYRNCPIPLSNDKRIHGVHFTGAYRNLLSFKGERRLALLKRAQEEGRISNALAQKAKEGAHKFLLDFDLFVGFDYLKSIPHNARVQEFIKNQKKEYEPDMQVVLTSGCYNGCVHCGYGATGPVSHMPYPLFFKLFKLVHPCPTSTFPLIYADSDPISYHDPIINADTGDVMLALGEMYKHSPEISFLTKGVLTKKDEVTLAKVVHNTRDEMRHTKDNKVFLNFAFSFVDLPGENVNHNLKRLQRTQKIYNQITPALMNIRHYALNRAETVSNDILSQYGKVGFMRSLTRVGRWFEMVAQLNLADGTFQSKEDNRPFCASKYVIASDLTLYDVFQRGAAMNWQPICSVFDKLYMRKLIAPKQIHPTILHQQKTSPSL